MEHFGCDCGEPLVKTKEIEELYEYISVSPHIDCFGAAENRELITARATIDILQTENNRLKEIAEFWAAKTLKLTPPSPILLLDKPKKE
jgi:hypothetical protein